MEVIKIPSLPTRKSLAEAVLLSDPSVSNRSIAVKTGLSRSLVGQVRASLVERGAIPVLEKRLGADGKRYDHTRKPESIDADLVVERRVKTLKAILRSLELESFTETYALSSPRSQGSLQSVIIQLAAAGGKLRALSQRTRVSCRSKVYDQPG